MDLPESGVIGEASIEDIVPFIQRNVTRELAEQYPGLKVVEGFAATLANAAEAAVNRFIVIIDEWIHLLGKQMDARIYRETIWNFCVLCSKTAE